MGLILESFLDDVLNLSSNELVKGSETLTAPLSAPIVAEDLVVLVLPCDFLFLFSTASLFFPVCFGAGVGTALGAGGGGGAAAFRRAAAYPLTVFFVSTGATMGGFRGAVSTLLLLGTFLGAACAGVGELTDMLLFLPGTSLGSTGDGASFVAALAKVPLGPSVKTGKTTVLGGTVTGRPPPSAGKCVSCSRGGGGTTGTTTWGSFMVLFRGELSPESR